MLQPNVTIRKTPPGPRAHVLVGTLPEFSQDPLAFLTRCAREYGDIVRLQSMRMPMYLLSHPDYVEQVLVTHQENFVKSFALQRSRLLLGNGLLTSEGDFWRRQRRLIQPAFHRRRIAAYVEVMVAYAERMLAAWHDGETLDVHAEMMRLTLEIVAKTLFDADIAGEAGEVGHAMHVVMERFQARASTGFLLPETLPTPGNLRLQREVRRLDEIIYAIVARRRADGRDHGDLLSMLLAAQDEDGSQMTDKQLRDEMMTLLLAGHETTAIALSWTWYLLSQHPEVEARLLAELDAVLGGRAPTVDDLPRLQYADRVVKESMRLYPPAWVVGREARSAFEIGGYTLPAGSTLLMSEWVLHRDARYFEAPEQFNPDRWTDDFAKRLPRYAYFPFGGGPRLCIGNSFALMEANLLLATIAQQFHLAVEPGFEPGLWPAVTLRTRNGIRVRLAGHLSRLRG